MRRQRPFFYILDGHDVRGVGEDEFSPWWVAHRDTRHVAQDTLSDGRWLSTVFLGMDHSHGFLERPLLFETMLFRSQDDLTEQFCRRYSTWDEAAAGHAAALKRLREGAPLYEDEEEDD